MRVYLLFAVLGLALTEAFLFPHMVRDFRMMERMRAETAAEAGLPGSLSPFAGYGADGRPLTLVTADTHWILPIVIRSRSLPTDLDYIQRLRKAVPCPSVTVLAICEEGACTSGPDQTAAGIPVLVYGPYAPLAEIKHFDDQNKVLLLNQFWGVRKTLGRADSAEDLAAVIQQEIR